MSLNKPRKIPTSPGIYIFSRGAKPLYVGKALNIKKRVASYFRKSVGLTPKIQKMLNEATALKTIKTISEIEALIKETELIKKYRPKYNSLMRDDKNYSFVGITKEEFPRVFVTHQPHEMQESKIKNQNDPEQIASQFNGASNSKFRKTASVQRYIGPFTSGGALYTTLKLLRRIFPYCTCKRPHKRPCLNSQIGKCAGYCCSQAQRSKFKAQNLRRDYRRNIQNIISVLTGKKTRLTAELKKQLNGAAKGEHYEEAARLRDQIFGLEDIFSHRGLIRHLISKEEVSQSWPEIQAKLKKILKPLGAINRIEGYDISNIAGKEATGSMIVFTDGQPDKSQYKKFRIKTVTSISDVDMIKEVLARRLKHTEWPYPELVVIDGGKPQLNAARSVIRTLTPGILHLAPPIVAALAKREEILYTEAGWAIYLHRQDPAILHLFQRIRDESHRFARAYHHKLREKHFAAVAEQL